MIEFLQVSLAVLLGLVAVLLHRLHLTRRLHTDVMRDVTEWRRTAAQMRESEARRQQLLEFLPQAVVVSIDERISSVNHAAMTLYGCPARNLIGRPVIDLVAPFSRELVLKRTAALHAGVNVASHSELSILQPNGRHLPGGEYRCRY